MVKEFLLRKIGLILLYTLLSITFVTLFFSGSDNSFVVEEAKHLLKNHVESHSGHIDSKSFNQSSDIREFMHREKFGYFSDWSFFLIDEQGWIIYHSAEKYLENQNLMYIDKTSSKTYEAIIDAVNNGGFAEYLWKDSKFELSKKIAYVKLVQNNRFILGASFFEDDVIPSTRSFLSKVILINKIIVFILTLILTIVFLKIKQTRKLVLENRVAKKTLDDSEERYSIIFESIGDGVITINNKLEIEMINKKAKDITGWDSDIIGKNLFEALNKEINPIICKSLESAFQIVRDTNHTISIPLLDLTRQDGKNITIEDSIAPLFFNCTRKNEDMEFVIVFRDVSERILSDKNLEESERRFKALHNASFGGIAIHDKGLILECNQGLSDMTGFSLEELTGMNGLLLITEDTRDAVSKNISEGYEKAYMAKGLRKDGSSYPLRLEARNIPYDGKQARVVEFRDMTEIADSEKRNKELEEQLQHSRKMEAIDKFSGGIAHDFNNIITAISGFSEIMLMNMNSDDENFENVSEIKKSCSKATELTSKLLTLSRKQVIHTTIEDINDLIGHSTNLAKRIIGEDINIELSLNSNKKIRVDASQFNQIFLNLAANARDAFDKNKENKTIKLTTKTVMVDNLIAKKFDIIAGEYIKFKFEDNGVGIEESIVDKIFEPFFTTKEKGLGTGFGLSTVYGIVKQNNGAVTIISEVGVGTKLIIYWPVCEEIECDNRVENDIVLENKKTNGDEKILFVEDEAEIRKLSTVYLSSQGYDITTVEDGEAALELIKNNDFDIVITDLVMPKMGGIQLSEEVKKIKPNLKFMFTSGYSSESMILNNTINYISKPYSLNNLSKKIRFVLDSK